MGTVNFRGGTILLEDRQLVGGVVRIDGATIDSIDPSPTAAMSGNVIDLDGGYLGPGFVDLHVHGGSGADFMDGAEEAFRTACRAHLRHGTTSLLPTTTVARHDQLLTFLELCRRLKPNP